MPSEVAVSSGPVLSQSNRSLLRRTPGRLEQAARDRVNLKPHFSGANGEALKAGAIDATFEPAGPEPVRRGDPWAPGPT